MITTLLIVLGGALLIGAVIYGLSIFEKMENKSKPKVETTKTEITVPECKPEPKRDTIEVRPASSGEESVETKKERSQEDLLYADKSVRFKRHQSIRDYHKTRWNHRNDTVTYLDDVNAGEECSIELDEEDVKKLVALRGLFDSKREED